MVRKIINNFHCYPKIYFGNTNFSQDMVDFDEKFVRKLLKIGGAGDEIESKDSSIKNSEHKYMYMLSKVNQKNNKTLLHIFFDKLSKGKLNLLLLKSTNKKNGSIIDSEKIQKILNLLTSNPNVYMVQDKSKKLPIEYLVWKKIEGSVSEIIWNSIPFSIKICYYNCYKEVFESCFPEKLVEGFERKYLRGEVLVGEVLVVFFS